MSFTTIIDSSIKVLDTTHTHRIDFSLPTTELRSISPINTPYMFSHLLEQAEVWSIDVSNFGSVVKCIAVKSSRPVKVKLINSLDVEYTMPYSTYLEYLLDSSEEVAETVNTIEVTAAPEPATAPTQFPARYPSCLLELFILTQ